jgi:hypothetical protein
LSFITFSFIGVTGLVEVVVRAIFKKLFYRESGQEVDFDEDAGADFVGAVADFGEARGLDLQDRG